MSLTWKLLLLFLILLKATTLKPSCSTQETMNNEGFKPCCYYDSKHLETIGYGLRLNNAAAPILQKYGLNLKDVLDDCKHLPSPGKHCLTQGQAAEIFSQTEYPDALSCVSRWIGTSHPIIVISAVVDMAFAGCGKLHEFVGMKAALDAKNYVKAAYEAEDSLWCTQVKDRCSRDKACFLAGGCKNDLNPCPNGQGISHDCCSIAPPTYNSQRCCPSEDVCVSGGCCPKDTPQLCDKYCCKTGSDCCGAAGCCDPGYVCVSGGCCPKDSPQLCGQLCCQTGSDCCGGTGCCNPGYHCCGTTGCCPNGMECCGNGCCPNGTYCCDINKCCYRDFMGLQELDGISSTPFIDLEKAMGGQQKGSYSASNSYTNVNPFIMEM